MYPYPSLIKKKIKLKLIFKFFIYYIIYSLSITHTVKKIESIENIYFIHKNFLYFLSFLSKILYSASKEEDDTISYFLDFHEIMAGPRKIQYPVIGVLGSTQ